LQNSLKEVLKQKEKFGNLKIGQNEKINLEFISANPTGPLTLGNGRGGFCGDVLANVFNKAGFKAKREYYINDTGAQIEN
jgi:arginyl-tRNA synthetase